MEFEGSRAGSVPGIIQKRKVDAAGVKVNSGCPRGVDAFEKVQKTREKLLKEMLQNFNEGRSKSYYCIAVTIFEIEELKQALIKAKTDSAGLEIKGKSKVLHSILDEIATRKNYCLKLRK